MILGKMGKMEEKRHLDRIGSLSLVQKKKPMGGKCFEEREISLMLEI
jgi:hypothetical protein